MCRRKMVSLVLVPILIVLVTSVEGLGNGNCQNDEPGENPEHLLSGKRWDEPYGNRVSYYIGQFNIGPAPLTTDVPWASSQWSRVQFNNETVNFELRYVGRTGRSPGYKDGWNVVDWGPVDPGYVAALTRRWYSPANPKRIIEVDTMFNYYHPYRAHGQTVPGTICLRDVATHEFGHWVELNDVGDDPEEKGVVAYERYTMYYYTRSNYHGRESLECEDKYGLWYTYNSMPWYAPRLAKAEIVEETSPLQNYPNPFNAETWIPYELSEDSYVVLDIHDVRGHLVRKFVLGRISKGQYLDKRHAAYWDGRNEKGELVPSGVYFYTLKANDFAATRKMVLLK